MKNAFLIEDNVAFELTFRRLFGKLWPFLRMYPYRISVCLFLVLGYTLVGRALPLLFGYAVDKGIKPGNWEILQTVAFLFLICELARASLAFGQSLAIQRIGNQVLYDIRSALVDHVQSLSSAFFDKTASGRVMTRVTNDVHSLGELFSQGFTTIFINIVEIVSILVALLAVSWRLTIVVVCLIPPLIWACNYLSRIIRVRFGAAKRRLAMINAFTAESIGGMKILQLFNQTEGAKENFNRLSREYRDLQLQTVRLFATLWPVVEAFNVSTVASTLLVGAAFQTQLSLSPGQLAAYVLLVQSFFRPLRGILEKYNQLQNSLASADRVFQMFEAPREQTQGAMITGKLKGDIEFFNVTFAYSPEAAPALRNVNIKINSGESVALVGRTGSGKTTFISLVQKLYEPQIGEIKIDQRNINDIASQSLRKKIAVVQQDNFMMRGTVADNISLMNPEISQEQVRSAARKAHCEYLFTSHTTIEERGANLSVGERQLISFARAIAYDPDVLILDEATANIDSVHEELIQKATAELLKGRTSLIVAHRLSTILHCDRIVLLSQGEIIEDGPHDELMKKRGEYFRLYQSQMTNPNINLVEPKQF